VSVKIYSPTVETFVGHRDEVATVFNSKKAAERRGEPLRPVLLWGPSGCGKTTLARLIGGDEMVEVNGASIESSGLAKLIFKMRRKGGFLLIDEIHAIGRREQELLYPLLDRGEFSWAGGTIKVKVSLIGTTTEYTKLSLPLRNRFSITIYLGLYSAEEIGMIVKGAAEEIGVKCDEEARRLIGTLSRGTPRNALSLLWMARDLSGNGVIGVEAARDAAASLGYDEDGLTFAERLYIISLYSLGRTVSLSVMSAILQQDTSSVKAAEGYLLQRGYINITPRGRELTLEGMEYAEKVLGEEA